MSHDQQKKSMLDESHLRQILDKMIEGVQVIGFDWSHLYVNDAIEKQSHFTKDQLIGYTMMERYPGIEQSAVFKVLKECMDTRLPKQIEIDFEFPEDKRKAWFELSIQPVEEGIFVLSIDVTDRKLAQEKIVKLNEELEKRVDERTRQLELANRELESFSYSVSHDLRAPLRSIIGYSQILEEELAGKMDDSVQRTFNSVKTNAVKMNTLIDELLAFSKLGQTELNRVDVNMDVLVKSCIAVIQHNSPYQADIVVHPLPSVQADSGMIAQAWTNLISNAFKYSSKVANPRIEIGSEKREDQFVFYVKDNGTGFDMKYVNKLFGVFQRLHSQRDFEGTGVGLSIVKRIVIRHGGDVWAEGKPGEGAIFYFSLPVIGKE